jgi:murein DD-endopeptidase MepM/ murein hydrolase activator NlpD
MTHARRAALCLAATLLASIICAAPAPALVSHPVVGELRLSGSAPAGALPRVTLRVDERGVHMVYVQVTLTGPSSPAPALTATPGWVPTRRALSVAWPAGAFLPAGGYRVTVNAHDHRGRALMRGPHTPGTATLSLSGPVGQPAPPASSSLAAATAPTGATPAAEAGVPSVAQTVGEGAVFPVAGAHDFGGPENRFGAPRGSHVHQGQDVLTAEGTPVIAPLPGTILTSSYQEGGAGYYAVEHTAIGFDFMFAHCQASTMSVVTGQSVSAGEVLCHAGQTGDATAPHLHFEMWVGGWQAPGGQPIDPLPYLEAWERAGVAG